MHSAPSTGARMRARPSPRLKAPGGSHRSQVAPQGSPPGTPDPGRGRARFCSHRSIPREAPFREFTEYILCEVNDLGRTTVSTVIPGPVRPGPPAAPGRAPERTRGSAPSPRPTRGRPHAPPSPRCRRPHAPVPPVPGSQERPHPTAPAPTMRQRPGSPPSGSEPSCFLPPAGPSRSDGSRPAGYSVVSR